MRTWAIVTILFVATGLITACHSPKGGWMPGPNSSHTYYSLETRPATIRMIDLRTGEEFFVMDIPAGKQLTILFVQDGGDDRELAPDRMQWAVWEIGTRTGTPRNAMSVPTARSRRIDVEYREGPEFYDAPESRPPRSDDLAGRPGYISGEGGPMSDDPYGVRNYDD